MGEYAASREAVAAYVFAVRYRLAGKLQRADVGIYGSTPLIGHLTGTSFQPGLLV